MIERDLYFAAFCINRGMQHVIDKGKVELISDESTIDKLRTEYKQHYKKSFDTIRSIHKQLQTERRKSSPYGKSVIKW